MGGVQPRVEMVVDPFAVEEANAPQCTFSSVTCALSHPPASLVVRFRSNGKSVEIMGLEAELCEPDHRSRHNPLPLLIRRDPVPSVSGRHPNTAFVGVLPVCPPDPSDNGPIRNDAQSQPALFGKV